MGSCEANIRAVSSVRGPYDVNQLATVAVRAALANKDYMLQYVEEVNKQSKPKYESYLRSRGIDFWPSSSNYIFCYFDDPTPLEKGLRANNVLVRPKKDDKGVLGLRVTIGTVEQTDYLIAALDALLPKVEVIGSLPAAKKQRV